MLSDDDFRGVGLSSFDEPAPPSIADIAKALIAIEELAAASELIQAARGEMALLMANASFLIEHGDDLAEKSAKMRSTVSRLARAIVEALENDDGEPDADGAFAAVLSQMRETMQAIREVIWPYANLAHLWTRYADAARRIGEAEQDLGWLKTVADRGEFLGEKADQAAAAAATFGEAADARSQLQALVEFIAEAPDQRRYQMQQAIELVAMLDGTPLDTEDGATE